MMYIIIKSISIYLILARLRYKLMLFIKLKSCLS